MAEDEGGGVQLGSMFWTLGLSGTLQEDVAQAEMTIDDLESSLGRVSEGAEGFSRVSTTSARQVRLLGSGAAAAGNALIIAGSSAREAEGAIGELAGVSVSAGLAFTSIGAVTSATFPIMRAYGILMRTDILSSMRGLVSIAPAQVAANSAVAASTQAVAAAEMELAAASLGLNPSLVSLAASEMAVGTVSTTMAGETIFAASSMEALAAAGYMVNPSMVAAAEGEMAAAAGATYLAGALRLLTAASVVGLVVVGGYLLYEIFGKVALRAKELESQIKDLNEELEMMRFVQTAMSSTATEASDKYNALRDSLTWYDETIKEAKKNLGELKDTEDDLIDNSLDLEEAYLNRADAINEWRIAAAKGDAEETERAAIAAARAQRRIDELEEKEIELTTGKKKGEKEEDKGWATEEGIARLEADRAAVYQDFVDAQAKMLESKRDEEIITDRIRQKDFQMKLLDWEKSGTRISEEDYATFSKVDWMKAAMDAIPKTHELTYMEWWKEAGASQSRGEAMPLWGGQTRNLLFPESATSGANIEINNEIIVSRPEDVKPIISDSIDIGREAASKGQIPAGAGR
jgi:hypothetical protein